MASQKDAPQSKSCSTCGHARALHYGPEGVCIAECMSLNPLIQCGCKDFTVSDNVGRTPEWRENLSNLPSQKDAPLSEITITIEPKQVILHALSSYIAGAANWDDLNKDIDAALSSATAEQRRVDFAAGRHLELQADGSWWYWTGGDWLVCATVAEAFAAYLASEGSK